MVSNMLRAMSVPGFDCFSFPSPSLSICLALSSSDHISLLLIIVFVILPWKYVHAQSIFSKSPLMLLQNARICHLVQILMRAELYAAANYLHDDLLQLGPVTQPEADLPPPALSKPDSSDDSQHGSTDKTHDPEDKEKLNAVADRAGGGVARMEAAPCEEMSDLLLEDLATISDRMSYYSSHHGSVMNQAGLQLSQLQRQDSVSYEDSEEAWIGGSCVSLDLLYVVLELGNYCFIIIIFSKRESTLGTFSLSYPIIENIEFSIDNLPFHLQLEVWSH